MNKEKQQKTIEADQLKELLPHRYPFLLIDRVLTWESGKILRAVKNVTVNEPFFQGHFPFRMIMPGVLIIEAMAQAGNVLGYLSFSEEFAGSGDVHFYLAGLDKLRISRPVIPGDQLEIEVHILKKKRNFVKMHASAEVQGQRVAATDMLTSLASDS